MTTGSRLSSCEAVGLTTLWLRLPFFQLFLPKVLKCACRVGCYLGFRAEDTDAFCIIEGRETVLDFSQMQLQEIRDNITSRRNKIFLLMEEVWILALNCIFCCFPLISWCLAVTSCVTSFVGQVYRSFKILHGSVNPTRVIVVIALNS